MIPRARNVAVPVTSVRKNVARPAHDLSLCHPAPYDTAYRVSRITR